MKLPTKIVGAAAGGALALALGLVGVFEGTRTQAYLDVSGVPTICTGHTGPDVKLGQVATKAMCDDFLGADLTWAFAAVDRCVQNAGSLPPWTRAAAASLAFNIGPNAFCGSTVARRLNEGKVTEACNAILMWNRAGRPPRVVLGLVNRREAERRLCLGEPW